MHSKGTIKSAHRRHAHRERCRLSPSTPHTARKWTCCASTGLADRRFGHSRVQQHRGRRGFATSPWQRRHAAGYDITRAPHDRHVTRAATTSLGPRNTVLGPSPPLCGLSLAERWFWAETAPHRVSSPRVLRPLRCWRLGRVCFGWLGLFWFVVALVRQTTEARQSRLAVPLSRSLLPCLRPVAGGRAREKGVTSTCCRCRAAQARLGRSTWYTSWGYKGK